MPNDPPPAPQESPKRSTGGHDGNDNRRPTVAEVLGKVALVVTVLVVAAVVLGALVLGTCVLLMRK